MPRAYEYDAFISHAVEDKIPIANELCDRLEKAGLKIWYSGRELNAGDSISTTIGDGLNQSRFGIVHV
ncbi:MAG: TIR domain-containing protein [Cytophagia bacterium]|nr:TIR domain-containing protein [Cytophagia bacterium]